MQNNNPQPDQLSPAEQRLLLSDINTFKTTFLYKHYRSCLKTLLEETVHQILNEPLKGPETLYAREGWIGEARASELQIEWFELLELELQKETPEQN